MSTRPLGRSFHVVLASCIAALSHHAAAQSITVDAALWTREAPARASIEVPLDGGRARLDLERFTVTKAGTRFVVGAPGGAVGRDRPIDFSPDDVVLYRGSVEGRAGSLAYLALSPWGAWGLVDGWGGARLVFSATGAGGEALPPGRLRLTPALAGAPACGVDTGDVLAHQDYPPGLIAVPPVSRGDALSDRLQIELAVETDYELYEFFNDVDATAAYIVALYGGISAIYARDVNANIDLTFVRIWDNPDDLFNGDDPLGSFRSYWNRNMRNVQRDAAQFFTGRRDLPWGGVAYLGALCGSSAYSVSGYAAGFYETFDAPSIFNRDIVIAAHEIGHNCGARHTHDYGYDDCFNLDTPARRGTIMSYCSQTVSGGESVIDLRFHRLVQGRMEGYLATVNCLVRDCNGNGISDALDISQGRSRDDNANGVPDECEDCNGNGVLDSRDIAEGRSSDLNGDGVPDECQPDCNSNGVPDDLDISSGDSKDLNFNNIPDECEPDLDGSGVADYLQIMADMSLDLDRDVTLDEYQDCNGNGVPDLVETEGSGDLWGASLVQGEARQFLAVIGTLVRTSDPGRIDRGHDVLALAGPRVLVTSAADSRVVEFDGRGRFVRDLVPSGGGGLSNPGQMVARDGVLYVASTGTNSVLRYDLATGSALGAFVAPGEGGLVGPFGLVFGPGGHLCVTTSNHRVLEFDGQTGEFRRTLVAAGSGGLSTPRGLLFMPDGPLLVTSSDNRLIIAYQPDTGALIGQWNRAGDGTTALTLDRPWCIRLGPTGNVLVSRSGVSRLHVNAARIYEFDPQGRFFRHHVLGNDTGYWQPSGFDFLPTVPGDCNGNRRPDACDIAEGRSQDQNRNGIPDECEKPCRADCDGNGRLDIRDFFCFQGRFAAGDDYADFDGNGRLDIRDFFAFQAAFSEGCG